MTKPRLEPSKPAVVDDRKSISVYLDGADFKVLQRIKDKMEKKLGVPISASRLMRLAFERLIKEVEG